MKTGNGKIVGILGAVILHLIAGIIFMLIRIGELKETVHSEILLEINQIDETTIKENMPELSDLSEGENLSAEDARLNEELSNIARNLSGKSDELIDRNAYIDNVKQELIASGKLGASNFIDDASQGKNIVEADGTTITDVLEEQEADKNLKTERVPSVFSGPTRIYYDLPGRFHTYLPIPIYKCEGSGTVTLSIEVTPSGLVTKASVIASESSVSDDCLIETAVGSATISRFNPDATTIRPQTGTITYHFVAQ